MTAKKLKIKLNGLLRLHFVEKTKTIKFSKSTPHFLVHSDNVIKIFKKTIKIIFSQTAHRPSGVVIIMICLFFPKLQLIIKLIRIMNIF